LVAEKLSNKLLYCWCVSVGDVVQLVVQHVRVVEFGHKRIVSINYFGYPSSILQCIIYKFTAIHHH
jgi:hypothetical protein